MMKSSSGERHVRFASYSSQVTKEASGAGAAGSAYLGIFLTVLSALGFSTFAALSKLAAAHVRVTTFLFVCVAGQAIPAAICVCIRDGNARGLVRVWRDGGNAWRLTARGAFGALVNILQLIAVSKIPIGNATTIFWSCPIFVGLISLLFLNERLTPLKSLCIVLTLIGCILVAQPEFLFPQRHPHDAPLVTLGAPLPRTSSADEDDDQSMWAFYSLAAAILQALALVVLRSLRNVDALVVVFHYGVFGGIVCALADVLLPDQLIASSSVLSTSSLVEAWSAVGAAALINTAASLVQSIAMRQEAANAIAIVSSLEVVYSYLWGLFVFDERPQLVSVAGALLVLSGVVLLGGSKMLRSGRGGDGVIEERVPLLEGKVEITS